MCTIDDDMIVIQQMEDCEYCGKSFFVFIRQYPYDAEKKWCCSRCAIDMAEGSQKEIMTTTTTN